MKRKRATSSKNSTRSVKSVNPTSKPFPLLSLPPELLDVILSYVLHLSLTAEDDCLPPSLTLKLPSLISVLHVCRELRHKGLALVANRCMWISLTANGKDQENLLYNIKHPWIEGSSLTTMPLIFYQICPDPTLSTIEMIIGKPMRRPRKANSSEPLLVPYNTENCSRIIEGLYERDPAAPGMTVQLPPCDDDFRRRLFESDLLPQLRSMDSAAVMQPKSQDGSELDEKYSMRRKWKYPFVNIRVRLS